MMIHEKLSIFNAKIALTASIYTPRLSLKKYFVKSTVMCTKMAFDYSVRWTSTHKCPCSWSITTLPEKCKWQIWRFLIVRISKLANQTRRPQAKALQFAHWTLWIVNTPKAGLKACTVCGEAHFLVELAAEHLLQAVVCWEKSILFSCKTRKRILNSLSHEIWQNWLRIVLGTCLQPKH